MEESSVFWIYVIWCIWIRRVGRFFFWFGLGWSCSLTLFLPSWPFYLIDLMAFGLVYENFVILLILSNPL